MTRATFVDGMAATIRGLRGDTVNATHRGRPLTQIPSDELQAAIDHFHAPAAVSLITDDSDERTALLDRLDQLAQLAGMDVQDDWQRLIRCCASRTLHGLLAELSNEHQADLAAELRDRKGGR